MIIMNKIILSLMLVLSSLAHSQEIAITESGKKVQLLSNGTYKYLKEVVIKETILNKIDFIKVDDRISFKQKPFYIINGDEKLIDIKFSYGAPIELHNSMDLDNLNSMISTANIKTMFKMKNRRTYIPKKVSFFYVDKDSTWLIAIDYIAQNDYGATKDGTSYSTFDKNGDLKDIIIP